MKSIFKAIFTTTWKRKESKLFLVFSLMPLVYLLTTFMKTSFMNVIPTEANLQFSFLEMYDGIFNLTFNSTLPSLALFLLVLSVFKKEIEEHQLFLFKDIERGKILVAKLMSLLLILVIYLVLFSICMAGVYYLRVVHLPYGSGEFLGTEGFLAIFSVFGTMMVQITYVFVLTLFSFLMSPVAGMISGIGLIVFSAVLPLLGQVGLLFPSGYRLLAERGEFTLAYLGCTTVTLCILLPCFLMSLKKFRKVEF